jgi:multicomponent Na+:H+ antiporter subunit G
MLTLDIILICIGLFFFTVAAIGIIRLPDVFSRSHAAGIADTVGAFFVLSGVALYQGLTLADVKTLLILLTLWHLNPVISHATLRAALRTGVVPWTKEKHESV